MERCAYGTRKLVEKNVLLSLKKARNEIHILSSKRIGKNNTNNHIFITFAHS
jgi:hypothetical protein